MFVQDNSVKSIKKYFFERLGPQFSNSELKLMFNEFLMERLELSRSEIISSDALRLSESDLLHFRAVVKRLQNQEPFQYVLGSTEFYGLELDCDPRALIPRPETEELVDWIVKEAVNPNFMIDLCTGSGCIALALKSALPDGEVYGVDISKEALALAEQNGLRTGLNVQFKRMDVLEESSAFSDSLFDIIVSNPPYVPVSDKMTMQSNVLDFEPGLALFVEDKDALIFYRKISEFGLKNLKAGGKLYFEIHENFAHEVSALMSAMRYQRVTIKQDLQGKNRMIKGELI